ncbi:MAG: hypothetical protein LBJ93_04120 [Clostridiales bacterium]|jgi:hypothetical protein|nr:hypothetical protein [Clostridiales bacterium]
MTQKSTLKKSSVQKKIDKLKRLYLKKLLDKKYLRYICEKMAEEFYVSEYTLDPNITERLFYDNKTFYDESKKHISDELLKYEE